MSKILEFNMDVRKRLQDLSAEMLEKYPFIEKLGFRFKVDMNGKKLKEMM